MINDVTSWKVICPVTDKNNGKTRWIKIGRAYKNRDGSTNVYLDALPSNSKLQLREWDEREDFKNKEPSAPSFEAAGEMPF